jgi:PHD/YefM family antitoxin component YafN of YafNO toxin-antitoxin module
MVQRRTLEKPKYTLEERVEYSNATQFRKLFLGVVDDLHANSYLRYIITKHGEPRAVVMSFAAYQMMYRALQQVTKLQNETSPDEAARVALRQLKEADSPEGSDEEVNFDLSASLIKRLDAVVEEVNDLRQRVGIVTSGASDRKLMRAR